MGRQGKRYHYPRSRVKQATDWLHDAHVREMCEAWDSRQLERLYTEAEHSMLSAGKLRSRIQARARRR